MSLETEIQICCLQRLIADRRRKHRARSHLIRALNLLVAEQMAVEAA